MKLDWKGIIKIFDVFIQYFWRNDYRPDPSLISLYTSDNNTEIGKYNSYYARIRIRFL